ncbi:MAG: trypsin-like serine peptidase, partial [Beijerinckiaceae bacterium]
PTKTLMCLIASQALVATAFAEVEPMRGKPPVPPKPQPGGTATQYLAYQGKGFTIADRGGTFLKGSKGTYKGKESEETEEVETTAPTSGIGVADVANTKAYPSRTVGLLKLKGHRCTGFLISRSIVMTAANCVYNWNTKKWYDLNGMWFSPGVHNARLSANAEPHASIQLPFQKCGVSNVFIPKNYDALSDNSRDYAFVFLKCKVGAKTGYFGLSYNLRWQYEGRDVRTFGYPLTSVYGQDSESTVNHETWTYETKAEIGTSDGYSGAPLQIVSAVNGCTRLQDNRSHCAVGVRSSTYTDIGGDWGSSFVRITTPIIAHALWFKKWENYVNP